MEIELRAATADHQPSEACQIRNPYAMIKRLGAFAIVAAIIGAASCVSPAASAPPAAPEAAPEPPEAPAAPGGLTAPPGDRSIRPGRDDPDDAGIVSYEARLTSLADSEREINNIYAYLRTLVTWLGNLEDAFDTHIHPTPAPFGTTEYTRRRSATCHRLPRGRHRSRPSRS